MSGDSDFPWCRDATADELATGAEALRSLRAHWDQTYHPQHHPNFGATFDGTLADIAALDWLRYEQFGDPACGVEGVALICGEALRRAAGLKWIVTPRGDWYVAEAEYPHRALCPLARVQEARAADWPQFNKHVYLLQEAAFRFLSGSIGADRTKLRAIINHEPDYLESLAADLASLRPPDAT